MRNFAQKWFSQQVDCNYRDSVNVQFDALRPRPAHLLLRKKVEWCLTQHNKKYSSLNSHLDILNVHTTSQGCFKFNCKALTLQCTVGVKVKAFLMHCDEVSMGNRCIFHFQFHKWSHIFCSGMNIIVSLTQNNPILWPTSKH